MDNSLIYRILEFTAWRMDKPQIYGAFHLIISVVMISLAVYGAVRAKRLPDATRFRLLSVCGWVLVLMEVYKQLFLYFIVNGGVYDWWYFPFQLCSVPMYLCILLPLTLRARRQADAGAPLTGAAVSESRSLASAFLTFLASYTFVGAAATFAVPEDILRSYVTLTFHGFIWHGILLFISLAVALSGMAVLSLRGFARSTALFLVMCVIAVIINIAAEPAMQAAHAEGLLSNMYAAMFYLNPYHISPQPIVDTVQKSAGIPVGLALYVLVIIIAAGAVDLLFSRSSSENN